MRTPKERTSGAWIGGCEITPDGGNEKTALQATVYGNPKDTQGAYSSGQFFVSPWRTCPEPDPRSLEGIYKIGQPVVNWVLCILLERIY